MSSQGNNMPQSAGKSRVNDLAISATVLVAFAIALVVFVLAPIHLTRLMLGNVTENRFWLGLTEGGIKMLFLFLYVWGISKWKEIHRVYQYHGAEHKVINAFEAGEEMTVENIQKHTTVHVRCGTSFLLVVILVSIVVFSALPWEGTWQRFAYKLPLLPVVAAIAYEVIKFAGSRKNSTLMRLILTPGLLLQRVTTQEPTDEMVEVALVSFQSVRQAEEEAETSSEQQVETT
ncbi:MAG TPA: DUF1385 domain-containing protein [Armatimonadota bacterium]|nr:DUF1385 domain-containing protein [Armatimonadota bacterium]HPP74671.1 DUF1385 domain-containing protein [Armatimonadota bacterium]